VTEVDGDLIEDRMLGALDRWRVAKERAHVAHLEYQEARDAYLTHISECGNGEEQK
jgi:hypothetical protein